MIGGRETQKKSVRRPQSDSRSGISLCLEPFRNRPLVYTGGGGAGGMRGASVRFAANMNTRVNASASLIPLSLSDSRTRPSLGLPSNQSSPPGEEASDWLIGCNSFRLARVQPTWRIREPKGGGQTAVNATDAAARLHGARTRARMHVHVLF